MRFSLTEDVRFDGVNHFSGSTSQEHCRDYEINTKCDEQNVMSDFIQLEAKSDLKYFTSINMEIYEMHDVRKRNFIFTLLQGWSELSFC